MQDDLQNPNIYRIHTRDIDGEEEEYLRPAEMADEWPHAYNLLTTNTDLCRLEMDDGRHKTIKVYQEKQGNLLCRKIKEKVKEWGGPEGWTFEMHAHGASYGFSNGDYSVLATPYFEGRATRDMAIEVYGVDADDGLSGLFQLKLYVPFIGDAEEDFQSYKERMTDLLRILS